MQQRSLNKRALSLACGLSLAMLVPLFLPIAFEHAPSESTLDVVSIELEEPMVLPPSPPPPRPSPTPDAVRAGGSGDPVASPAMVRQPRQAATPSAMDAPPLDRLPMSPLPMMPQAMGGGGGAEGSSGSGGLGAGDGTGSGTGSGDGLGRGTEVGIAGPVRELTIAWADSMDFRRLHAFYPNAARLSRRAGIARLDCLAIADDRVRDCRLLGETPRAYGFGRAALRAEGVFRIRVSDQTGAVVTGERIVVNAHFRPR